MIAAATVEMIFLTPRSNGAMAVLNSEFWQGPDQRHCDNADVPMTVAAILPCSTELPPLCGLRRLTALFNIKRRLITQDLALSLGGVKIFDS
jgi:hypothetical protein